MESFQMMYKSQFQKKMTLMTGFVVQGHIFHNISVFIVFLIK